jgi:Domain of unknown function (DUF4331)
MFFAMNQRLVRNPVSKLLAVGLVAASAAPVAASSHREAPGIAEDQYVDNTDVYSFISPTDPSKLVIVANYVPLLLPQSGPNFYRFSDDARYEIHIDNDGDAVPDLTYRYRFANAIKNGGTFLYNTGAVDSLTSPNLNVTQSYRLSRVDHKTGQVTTVLDPGTWASAASPPTSRWRCKRWPRRAAPDRSPVPAMSPSSSICTSSTCSAWAARPPPTAST